MEKDIFAPILKAAKYTRAEYLAGACDIWVYYSQFVTPGVIALVDRCVGLSRIKASKHPFFGDIPLAEWDALRHGVSIHMDREQFEKLDGPAVSLSDKVCIAKSAAELIRRPLNLAQFLKERT
jgi:hypothetical protein